MNTLPIIENSLETPLAEPESSTAIVSADKLRRDIALSSAASATVARARKEIGDILEGRDGSRMLIVCGPCSIDDVNSALVYADRLRRLSSEVDEKVLLVMRTYFEKPRSVVGWKGLMYRAKDGLGTCPSEGLGVARRLAARINQSGLPCATEFLNPLLSRYVDDCMAYGSIGSRTVESQIHREFASGLLMPIGMKNAMDGNVESALNAVRSANARHSYFGSNLRGEPCLIESAGNNRAHLILRGGSCGPNFDKATVDHTVEQARALGLPRPVVVDCSHGNSRKDHRNQAGVATEVLRQMREGQNGIAGIMLESHLVEGRQDAEGSGPRAFGQSITDACMGWKDTEYLVKKIAGTL